MRGGRRFGVRATATAVAVLVAATMAILASAVGGDQDSRSLAAARARTASVAPTAVTVSLDGSAPGSPVPANYLGLSFEATDLQRIAEYGARGDLVGLLRSLGPGLLRFGGVSADTRIAWADARTPAPPWAGAVLGAGDFRELRRLAQDSGWRVLLTVGLAHYSPRAAAREVAAAHAALGPWLAGIEVGNEPDAYARHGMRRLPWNFSRYDAEVRAYRRAIARLVPGVPIDGPGVSGSHVFARWGPKEARSEHPALLTGHHYPLGCRQQPQPSIERLLSAEVRVMEGLSLQRYMAVSRRSGTPFRMDEANSVYCGGEAGISNTFASALWATGYIAQSMSAGVAGINFEGNPANCFGYSAVCAPTAARLAAGGLNAQPLWYALLMARNLLGDRPLGDTVSSAGQPNLALDTFITPTGALRFSIVDDEPPGSAPVALSLRVGPGFTTASVLSLTAPSPESTGGVTLGGRTVSAGGSWSEPSGLPRVPVQNGIAEVTVQPSSAALVTVAPAG